MNEVTAFGPVRRIEMYGRCFIHLVDLARMLGISDDKTFRARFDKAIKYGGRLFIETSDIRRYLHRSRMDDEKIEAVRLLLTDLERATGGEQRATDVGQPPYTDWQRATGGGQQSGLKSNPIEQPAEIGQQPSNVGQPFGLKLNPVEQPSNFGQQPGLKSNPIEKSSEIELIRQEVNLLWKAVGRLTALSGQA